MNKLMNKRGASPLIATIVLIAFAVSLGGFIMSLGGFYYEKMKSGDECSEFMLNVLEFEGSGQCSGGSPQTILNFYNSQDNIAVPSCYKLSFDATGKVCSGSGYLFNKTWVPSKENIR